MKSTRDIINSLFDPRSSGWIIMQYIELPKDEIQRRFSLVLEKIKGMHHTCLKPAYTFRDVDIDSYASSLYSAWFNRSFTLKQDVDEYLLINEDCINKNKFNYLVARYTFETYNDNYLSKRFLSHLCNRSNKYKLQYRQSLYNLLYDRFNFMMENQGEDNIMIYKYNTVDERMRYDLLNRISLSALHEILKHREINGMTGKSKEEIIDVLVNEIEVGKDGNIIVKRVPKSA